MPVYRRGQIWWVRVQVGGQCVRQSAGKGATHEEAKRLEAEIRAGLRLRRRGIHTLDDAIAEWIDGAARALKSRRKLLEHLAILRPYCRGKLLTDAPQVAQTFVSEHVRKVRPATINRKLAILKRVCRLAYREWGWLSNPIDQRIKLLPEHNKRGTFITPAQVEALAQACDNQAAADMIRLAAFSGLRLSELWRAEHQDGKLYLSETKSGKPRMVPLPVRVQAIAAKLPLPITRATFRRHFEKARAKVGLTHVRPHDMRHTFASLLIQAGASLATVQELMGHSTIAITKDLYGHLTDEHRDAAVRLLDNL